MHTIFEGRRRAKKNTTFLVQSVSNAQKRHFIPINFFFKSAVKKLVVTRHAISSNQDLPNIYGSSREFWELINHCGFI